MIKTKVAFLEGRLLFSQPEQLQKFSKSSDWLEKSRPFKKPLLFWSCKQAKYETVLITATFPIKDKTEQPKHSILSLMLFFLLLYCQKLQTRTFCLIMGIKNRNKMPSLNIVFLFSKVQNFGSKFYWNINPIACTWSFDIISVFEVADN